MAVQEIFASDPQVAALTAAAARGDAEEVKRLAAAGADVNARGAQNVTPLVWTLAKGKLSGLKALLEAGADPNFQYEGKYSAMSLAASGNRPEALEVLLQHGGDPNLMGHADDPMLNLAALHHRRENINLLLAYGADINGHRPISGSTAADIAVGQGLFDLAVELLERGLDYNLKDLAKGIQYSHVPADSPQQKWRKRLIEMLEAKGYKVPQRR